MGNQNSQPDHLQVPNNWNVSEIPSLKGKLAIVTGANSGIGYQTALELARKGAHVVLSCRNETRGRNAETNIREVLASAPDGGSVEFMMLDVSDLGSVQKFTDQFKATHDALDLLINNAGIMGGTYTKTVDGYERQFATNHLGHFALTAQLFPLLKKRPGARVVNVSSGLNRLIWSFDDQQVDCSEQDYSQVGTYNFSKLCNVLFTLELDRRLKSSGVTNVISVSCHPGVAATNLDVMPSVSNINWFWMLFFKLAKFMPQQSAHMGALPTLYASTGITVGSGDYFGPKYFQSFGCPVLENPPELAKSTEAASKLWSKSERLAHLTFSVEN
ncbi:Glycoside hydrolase [Phytophthora megakarya]|uniref:Glycoside hydrolase n=1 Tax=Phytophthora megakarya TaxID=4795 RepID=A0A225WY03_9STRA|nr:Glycoside hydrolase [Phytophthora megakarya]